MSKPDYQAMAAFCAQHYGVVTLAHSRYFGLSSRQIEELVASGQWLHVYESVYLVASTPRSWRGDLLAACWAGGFRAAASHRSAAAIYGLAGGRHDVAEITCPRWLRARHPAVEVHETDTLGPPDLTVVAGIPVTSPERTLLDVAAVCRPIVVLMAFDKARKKGLVTFESTEAMLRRLGGRGRRGTRVLRWALAMRDRTQSPPESEMETLMLEVIRRHGLPDPVPQYEVWYQGRFVARPDAAYPSARLAIEYQSYQEHVGPEPLVRDTRRANRLKAIGWLVFDVTAPELRDGGDVFCAAIREGLRRVA